jgi:hypothetical protein
LQVAKRFVGVREEGGANRGPWVEKFLAFVGLARGNPWCASWAVYCCHLAAKELGQSCSVPKTGSTSAIARWAKKTGNLLDGPEPGCLALVRGNAYGTGYVHTALVHDVLPDGLLLTVEGNWLNSVRWNRRKAAGCDFARIV